MSEWSKEPDLSPGVARLAGSNPASCNFLYSLAVRILGFHPSDLGSIPSREIYARLAQLVERQTFNLVAKGSIPLSGI